MNGFMYKLAMFFRGRYGVDRLFWGICTIAIILSASNLFIRSFAVQILVYLTLLIAAARAISRNCDKRRREEEKFMSIFTKISSKFRLLKNRFRDRKTHVYCKCKNCKKTLRLPKKKGMHTVICPNCRNKFQIKI